MLYNLTKIYLMLGQARSRNPLINGPHHEKKVWSCQSWFYQRSIDWSLRSDRLHNSLEGKEEEENCEQMNWAAAEGLEKKSPRWEARFSWRVTSYKSAHSTHFWSGIQKLSSVAKLIHFSLVVSLKGEIKKGISGEEIFLIPLAWGLNIAWVRWMNFWVEASR